MTVITFIIAVFAAALAVYNYIQAKDDANIKGNKITNEKGEQYYEKL